MELVLEHGIRANRAAAERLAAARSLRRLSLTGLQQRVEVLRMYGQQLASVTTVVLTSGIKSNLVPRLEFVAVYACVSQNCLRFAANGTLTGLEHSRFLALALVLRFAVYTKQCRLQLRHALCGAVSV